MRIGQTSIVFFVSKVVGSAAGFVATVYFARRLGAEVLGTYSLVLAVVTWFGVIGKAGVPAAVGKRISEGNDRDEYFTAALVTLGIMLAAVSTVVYAFAGPIETYIGDALIQFVLVLLALRILDSLVKGRLTGYHLVHIIGILIPVRMLVRSLSQIGLVFLGLGLTGMLTGHVVGYLVVSLVGLWYVSPSIVFPSKHHFKSLFSYARYSWLGSVENRVFGWIDITVLGLFVSSGLTGIYSVSWTISTFFLSFSAAVSNAIFPEISKLSASRDNQAIAPILNDALRYAGLILIPGVVGGLVLNRRILRVYGGEFQQGGTVLLILLLVVLFRSYYRQMVTMFNGLDRPDITFRINAVFIGTNVVMNFILVFTLGWTGAAIATAFSTALGTALSYYYLTKLVEFEIPYLDIGNQCVAATIMGICIFGLLQLEHRYSLVQHNFALVFFLVGLGAGIYFVSLFTLSKNFRTTVYNNLKQAG